MKEHPPTPELDQMTWPHRSALLAFSQTSSPCSFSCLYTAGSNLLNRPLLPYFVFISYPSLPQMSDLSINTSRLSTQYVTQLVMQPPQVQCLYLHVFLYDWQWSPQWKKSHLILKDGRGTGDTQFPLNLQCLMLVTVLLIYLWGRPIRDVTICLCTIHGMGGRHEITDHWAGDVPLRWEEC